MRVGVDLDGVIYDFVGAFRSYLGKIGAVAQADLLPDPTQWDFWHDWYMDFEEWKNHFHSGVANQHIFYTGRPLPGAQNGLINLRALGHSIHIISDRPFDGAERFTKNWLWQNMVPFDTLTISPDKTVDPTDIFLDDKPANVRALIEAGTRGVLLDRPWNREHSARDLPRVDSWLKFFKVVKDADKEMSSANA